MATLRITEEAIAIPGVLPALEEYFDSMEEITLALDRLGNTRMYIVQKDGLPDDHTPVICNMVRNESGEMTRNENGKLTIASCYAI